MNLNDPKPFAQPPFRFTRDLVWAVLILLALTAFRLWYCTRPGILDDEAYYWLWSKHLDASYYSKGPGVAWTIAFGTQIFGDTTFGIRWLSVILSAGTGWQLFRLARRLHNERTALIALIVAAIVPIFALGSVIMTIDPLCVFFWVWAANLFLDAIGSDEAGDWMLLGLALGLGFLAKFVNALELVCFILFLAWEPSARRHLRNPKVLLALVMFLICTIPVFAWNAQHGWITATHLKERGALNHTFHISPMPFLTFVGMQAVVISPLLFIGVLISIFAVLFDKKKTARDRYLLCLLLPTFLFYAVLALNNKGEPNWTATGYIGAFILAAAYWREQWARESEAAGKGWRRAICAAVAVAIIETAFMHETAPLHLPVKIDPLNRARGWDTFSIEMETLRQRYKPQLLIGNHYQAASLLSWYLPDRPHTYVPNSKQIQNQFSFWPGYDVSPGMTALFVSDEIDNMPPGLKKEFGFVERVDDFWTEFQGRKLKHYAVYYCHDKKAEGPQ